MCVLEQSVWFENMAVDKNDNPQYDIVYTDNIDTKTHLFDEYNLMDYCYGHNRYILMSELLKANSEDRFTSILENAGYCESITIVDDLNIENTELGFINEFYQKVFFNQLSQHCRNCYVYDPEKIKIAR